MNDKEICENFKDVSNLIINDLDDNYFRYLRKGLLENPQVLSQITGFLINPAKIIFYFGKTHLAIEYVGSECINEIPKSFEFELEIHDYTQSDNTFFEDIIGFRYDSTTNFNGIPLPAFCVDFIIPTNRGMNKLSELNWNYTAQDMFLFINSPSPTIEKNQFTRMINTLFFDSNEYGLITRHIKWIDFIPLEYDDSDDELDKLEINVSKFYTEELLNHDFNFKYPLPKEFRTKKLPQINRFIELIGNKTTSEPEITQFLAKEENKFIITMNFGAIDIFDELECEWQSEIKDNIKPDFFVLSSNGYANILEFKLPNLKTQTIVGKSNRETFSSEINSYISQTRTYESFFDDPNNKTWFENKYKFKVYKPRRILVAGRRSDFERCEFREIQADFRNIELITFDDLIDGVVSQFYR